VERQSGKVSGAWVFRGTRVPVASLFENLRDGASIDDFVQWSPGVTRRQVEAVINAVAHHSSDISSFGFTTSRPSEVAAALSSPSADTNTRLEISAKMRKAAAS